MDLIKKKRLLKNLASKYPAILVTGARSVSRERLVRDVFPTKSFINLCDKATFNLAKNSPRTFLLAFPDGAIINDIELLPAMVNAVRYFVEKSSGDKGRWIMIATPDLEEPKIERENSLLGILRLSGLSISELDAEHIPTDNPFSVMFNGLRPDFLSGERTIDDFLNTIIEKDIRRFINVSNKEDFRNFIKSTAQESAKQTTVNSIAQMAGTTAPTAKSWLRIMEKTGLIRYVNNEENPRSARFFFTDTGVLCHLLGIENTKETILGPYKDQIVSTFTYNELVRGRDNRQLEHNLSIGSKCDLLARWRENYAIVIEPNIEITETSLQRIKTIQKSRKIKPGSLKPIILYLGDVTYSHSGIDCISYRDWEKLSEGIDYFS